MDKGSNISFPLDSGSTVYNGSGISVGGKASTDILHAAGGTTKVKTLNGESILGEGNIIIDPSSVPVSLSWYNRTSSQQDATINLMIGDTTVNLFPNIFKLFKAGKVSTSESLSIELTANPGASGVPQVPTSLCQWSIPLADSNTAGIISSEDKAKLDNLSDPKNLLAYGVEWDSTNSSPVLARIGNMSLHKSLPIQSALRGCVCQGKRIMYYLDPNDWSKKADGTDSRLDGYDGTVQVEVPEFYLWSETEGTKSRVYVSTQKVVPYAIRIPHMLVDAYRSTVLNEVPEDMGYLSTLQVNSAISVVNTSSYCRGGNNSSSSDTYLESDKFRTNLGKPRTNASRANFRTYAKNAGKMLLTMEHDGFMSLEDRNYPRRHEDDGFMDVFDSRSNRFGDRFRDSGMRGNDMDRIIKYMRHSMNDGEHFTESEAMDLVSDMYHTEGGRKYSGEKFDIHKAKEICERYRGVIPVSATPTDVYVAINSQYHDYVELFKSWFGDNVDQKIIESAIIFWFKDVDCKSRNKVVSYFKEY